LWQRLADPAWWGVHEAELRQEAGNNIAVIERPARKRLIIEVACPSETQARRLQKRFGGRVRKLRVDWLKQFARAQKTKSLHIGKRLLVTNDERISRSEKSHLPGCSHLVIPAGAAFGTGQHPTTAMSLRMLEQLTRRWKPGWTVVDLGTGSGIFALSARRLGAGRMIAVDNDPIAISTAKGNAKLNRISKVQFVTGDVLRFRLPRSTDVLIANLFSELLVQLLAKTRGIPFLILSGVMRNQEKDVRNALRRAGFQSVIVRRRGKWVAMLAQANCGSAPLGD
jgi:ribosomal protein L11 methyltransferase